VSERQANQIRGLSTTSPLHCVIVSTGIMSDHTGRRDASRVGGCYNESARFTRNFKVNNLDLVLLNYQHSRADSALITTLRSSGRIGNACRFTLADTCVHGNVMVFRAV